jgi:hypothetical protein
MKAFISTTTFGYINYILALVTGASPWIFGFEHFGGAALFFPLLFGWHQLLMAIFSRSKAGMVGIFPIQMHCFLDTFAGFVLMVTPWMYGFHIHVWAPHVILGGIILILGIFTKGSPMTNPPHEMRGEAGIESTDEHEGRMMV